MNRLLPWIIRLFISVVLALILFCLAVGFFLNDTADDAKVAVYFVILPLGIAILIGFYLPSAFISWRWRYKWLPIAEGTKEIPEFEQERFFSAGLRAILNPLNLPTTKLDRLRQYSLLWAQNLLKSRQRDDWCWELYTMVLPDLIENPEHFRHLRMLVIESDTLTEPGFHAGLEFFSLFLTDSDLAFAIARASLAYDDDLLPERLRIILESAWLLAYDQSENYKKQILKKLIPRLIAQGKRDHEAATAYLASEQLSIHPPGLNRAMEMSARFLEQNRSHPELVKQLTGIARMPLRPSIEPIMSTTSQKEAALDVQIDSTSHDEIKLPSLESKIEEEVEEIGVLLRPEEGWRTNQEKEATLLESSRPLKSLVDESLEEAAISETKPSHLPTEFGKTASEASFGDFSTIYAPQIPLFQRLIQSVKQLFKLRLLKKPIISEKHIIESESADIIVMRRKKKAVFHRIQIKFIIIFAITLLIIAGSYVIFNQIEQRTQMLKAPSGMYRPGRISSLQPYTVQVAAHSSLERAIEHIKILRNKGVNVYLVQPQEGASKWYRVRFGEFNSPAEAKLTADSLKTHGIIQEFFVTQFETGVMPEEAVK